MKNNRIELYVMVSECCGADFVVLEEDKDLIYYQNKCSACGKPCSTVLGEVYDSAGVQIKPGDVVETVGGSPAQPPFHIAIKDGNHLQIRDLDHNNIGMYDYGKYYTRGSWRFHLDKLTSEDIEWYELEKY